MIKVQPNWVPGISNETAKSFYYTRAVGANLSIRRYREQERLRIAEYFSMLSNTRLEVRRCGLYKSA